MTAHNIKRFLLDILYPNKCPFCGEVIAYNSYCCDGCPEDVGLYGDEPEPIENIVGTFAVFEYGEASLSFVYKIKEGGDGYAVSAAAKLISERLERESVQIDVVACVPADSARMRERGYNPPALIAEEISAIIGVKHDPKLLIKTRRTEVQKSLSAQKRRENLKGAFRVNGKRSTVPKNVLLIDDVRTTGSTLSEAAGVLIAAGAEKVFAGVVAAVKSRAAAHAHSEESGK